MKREMIEVMPLTKQDISFRHMFTLIWPIFIELLLQMLVGNIDQMMVAHYSQDAVGAISNANQVLNILLLVFSMMSMATTILASQYKGARDERQLQVIYTLSCAVNLLLSLLISAAIFLWGDAFFHWMRVPEVFLAPARDYLHIVGSCCFLQGLFMTFSAIFRSNQLMRTGMVVSILVNITNVIGNVIFIHGAGPIPALGVKGAAIATNLSRLVGTAVLVFLFYRHLHGRLRLAHLRPFPTRLLKKLLAVGVPSGGESFSYSISQLVVVTFINTMGPDSVTARAYCNTIASFAVLYCLAASQATQILVGHAVGAKRFDDADRITRRAALSSTLVTTLCSIAICLMIQPILGLFGATPSVKALCQKVMYIEVLLQFGRSFNMLYIRALQGAGDIRFPIAIGILDNWVTVVGLGYILGCVLGLGLPGAWLAMALDENIRGLIFHFRWQSGKWKAKVLT